MSQHGYCKCGCGGRTKIAGRTRTALGHVKGEPLSYILGHNGRLPDHPYDGDGLCECGCGQETTVATKNERALGHLKGVPVRFRPGHGGAKATPYRIADMGYSTPCWIWQRTTSEDGYGRMMVNGKAGQYAHRVYYERAKGAIPTGLQVDHLCMVRACVNPEHLEAVTQAENIRRAWAARRAVAK